MWPTNGADASRLQGLPDQTSYDKALAVAQLVLVYLFPAYLASLAVPPADLHLHLSTPPPLAAGLTTPLPAAFTGDARDIDTDEMLSRGLDALQALDEILGAPAGWALGAECVRLTRGVVDADGAGRRLPWMH